MKITKSKRYKRFVSFSGKSRSFIREKPLILSSIIHNNKTITITLFIASRKRRSINTFQFVKPIQRCLINAGDILLPIYIYIYIYPSISIVILKYQIEFAENRRWITKQLIELHRPRVSRNIDPIRQISLLSRTRGWRHLTNSLGS